VHELGHFIVARWMGLPARLPIFVGPLGAFTNLRRAPADAGKSGIIALAGPALGTLAALLCFLLASTAAPGYARYLLLALAYFGCFLNLINLIPVGFLDGARIADAIPKWMNVVGLLVVAAVVLLFGNPIGLIFLILGIFHTIGRFRRSNTSRDAGSIAASRRLGLGAAYIAILLVAAGGMSVANTALVNSNYVPGVNQSTGTTVL
jgi:Zn-dependent protease